MSHKKDRSLRVPQGEKIKNQLELREFNWTEKQKNFINLALNKETKMIFCEGVSGTGKTLLSIFIALTLLNEKKIAELLFIRTPVESSGFGLGYLKGDLEEKFNPYLGPLEDKLNELLKKPDIDSLKNQNKILTIPIGFLRGASINSTCIIAEEAQNYTVKDFLLIMSRMGKFSKLIFIGDSQQSDIKHSGFKTVSNLFNNKESEEKGIHCFRFEKEDILRNEILSFIIEKFESIK